MEFAVVDSTTLETTIDIDEETPVQEESFQETIEISHDVNITLDNNKDPLDLSTEIDEKYSIRPCYIHVERCDKIWETMKLIRELQEPPSDSTDSNEEDYLDDDEETMNSPLNDEESNSSSQANPTMPYIKYQPVLGNGNTALPNFQFSVKSTRALYQCNTCGRQYSHRKTLREHSERMHNIILPMIRRPPKYKAERSDSTKKDFSEEKSADVDDEESTHESASTISSNPSEDKERLLDSTSETQEATEYTSPSGKVRHYGPCKHCSRILSDKYYLKVHETLIHGVVSSFSHGSGPLVLRNYVAKAKDIINCDHCDYSFYGFDKLTEHKQIIHGITASTSSSSSSSSSASSSTNSSEPCKINGRKQVATKKPATSSLKTLAFKQTRVTGERFSTNEIKSSKSKLKSKSTLQSSLTRAKPKKILRTCEACGKLYSNDTNWKVHLITIHGIVPPTKLIKRKKSFTNNSLGIHSCKYCSKRFTYATTLRNHVILQHITDQITSQKSLKPQKSLQLQRKSPPPISKSPSCSLKQPQKPPPKLTKIVPQETQDSKAPVYSCSACSSTYCSRQSLLYHMANVHHIYQTHTRKSRLTDVNKPHKCQCCHERFWNKKNLQMHQLIFHGIRDTITKPNQGVHLATKRAMMISRGSRNMKIERPPQLTPVRSLRDKERLNYDEADQDMYKTPRAPRIKTEANTSQCQEFDFQAQPTEDPIIQCILCNRHCKKIKKHFIEFHKVRNPEILISQCKISPMNPLIPLRPKKEMVIKPPKIKKDPDEVVLPARKRRPLDSMRRKKAMTIPGPQALFELGLKQVGGRKRRIYCCKLCTYVSFGYEVTRKHCKVDHPGAKASSGASERSEGADEQLDVKMAPVVHRRRSEGQLMSRKRRRESLDEREMQKRRISSAFGGELRMTRAVKRLKAELEHKCENCERMFRNGDILASHKVSCKSRTFESGMESNDTRESSDRDSGIGISITIKKKNDSYEIVSRDSSGERPSKRSNLDGYSDSSDTRHSLSFSNEHRVIKLEKMDDDDVEVDLDSSEAFVDEEFETVDAVDDPPPGEILSLKDLCRRALGHTRQVPKVMKMKKNKKNNVGKPVGRFQCKVCKGFWASMRGRNTHSWKAHKVSASAAALRGYQPDSLRTLCVHELENSGDKEARKKVWFPCHICNTVWPTVKSRRTHVNSHNWKASGNLLLCK